MLVVVKSEVTGTCTEFGGLSLTRLPIFVPSSMSGRTFLVHYLYLYSVLSASPVPDTLSTLDKKYHHRDTERDIRHTITT